VGRKRREKESERHLGKKIEERRKMARCSSKPCGEGSLKRRFLSSGSGRPRGPDTKKISQNVGPSSRKKDSAWTDQGGKFLLPIRNQIARGGGQ